MITPEVARAHIDELRRVAAIHRRAAAAKAPRRRLLTRSPRRG